LATIINYRKLLLAGVGIAVILLLLLDRSRLTARHQSAQVEAKEDALRRQTAVVAYTQATLIAAILEKLSEDSNSLEIALFVESSDLLNTLWKYEKEIDQSQFERATVSAKRLLDALDCKKNDDFMDIARNKIKLISEKNGTNGFAEVTNEHLIGFLGFDNSEDFDHFCEFVSRACSDSVFDSDDYLESRIRNAPGGVFRGF
jgi:hypothetical protein